jgi:hypothetical protein
MAGTFGGLGTLFINRHLMKRDERRRACSRYWSEWSGLVGQVCILRSAFNAYGESHRSVADLRQRARDAEQSWRAQESAVREIGYQDLAEALAAHVRATEQNIKAADRGEWPPDDGRADRRLHPAMRRHRLK